MPIGSKILTEAVFRNTSLNPFLDALKRDQGASVAAETVAFATNPMDMTGISVNRIDAILDREDVRSVEGLGASGSQSVLRRVERLSRNSNYIVRYLGGQLTSRYGVTLDRVLMNWTSMYFEAPVTYMSMTRFLYPELRTITAETMVSELTALSLTVRRRRNGLKRRIFSNFGTEIRILHGRKPPVPVPKAPGQTSIGTFT